MARILGAEAFGELALSQRVFSQQRYDLYRVYSSRTDFIEVEASTAAEAFARSGVRNARRIEHRLPLFRAPALRMNDIVPVRAGEEIVYAVPPEVVVIANTEPASREFVPLTYAGYGREQRAAQLLGRISDVTETIRDPDADLSEADVDALLHSREDPST